MGKTTEQPRRARGTRRSDGSHRRPKPNGDAHRKSSSVRWSDAPDGHAHGHQSGDQWHALNWPGGIVRPGTDPQTVVQEMILTGADAAVGPKHRREHAAHIADQLARADAGREPWLATRVACEILLSAMDSLYEHGWQPRDVIHVVSRAHPQPVTDLAVATVTYQAALSNATQRAPLMWAEQLEDIAAMSSAVAASVHWAATRNPGNRPFLLALGGEPPLQTDWPALLRLIGQWHDLPVWPLVCDPPSQWPEQRTDAAPRTSCAGPVDTRVLNKVRSLLAKAEATTYTSEADAFTAKAQELMTRYAIDAALLRSNFARGDVQTTRIHIENPYTKAKVHLLHEISLANRVRVVWDAQYAVATAVGTPVDLRQVEMLYTSVLVQATHAMTDLGRNSDDPATRTASFRRAFLFAFAVRVGQRLQEVGEETTARAAKRARLRGKRLLPILAAQNEAVNAEFERLFPRTEKQTAAPMDARGWIAGKVAADQAVLQPAAARIEAAQ
ncbi:DUF2786 domain-containing protein [Hoyosella sp. YIM 151337]|uniref:DUF2786 domain-containing protein n=1 Tax=Hoyosella sp. YIM 151337 TaxID=2992742 RepID=UPI002235BC23|nr:DUF2786 domain-containing protein [Hoyosella sp. YIM 151337]MCW4352027.1 DUF2786 domain-containing protein [Hoyosella sp. YIM 151337]